jgi:hypothetical protein
MSSLTAEIKFRLYGRMGTMPKLLENLEKLMDETTIKLVDLIYWKLEKRSACQQRIALSLPMDVNAQDIQLS